MSTANDNPNRQSGPAQPREKLRVAWYVHVYVWAFMITLGLSPVLYLVVAADRGQSVDLARVLAAVLLIQQLLWIAQRRCFRDDLWYWEGLLIAASSMRTGFAPLSLLLSFCVLLFTVAASFVFALTHQELPPMRRAPIRFATLIVAIHRKRLCR